MQLEHHFIVPVPVADAWEVLLDVERIAPCMPGATVESFDGETIAGRVKVKVGPIQVTYTGTASFTEKDEAARRAVIVANAEESRGTGTAAATITAVLAETGSATDVAVTTDLQITGKPAQFDRGVMVEVGNKILGKFADCLAEQLQSGELAASAAEPPATAATTPVAAAPSATTAPVGEPAAGITAAVGSPAPQARLGAGRTSGGASPREAEAIDLLDTAGLPVLKRVAPVLAGLVVVLVLRRLVTRAHG